MPRRSIVRVKTEIAIPFDRSKFGAATEAETAATKIKDAIMAAIIEAPAELRKHSAEHATEEVPASPAAA